MTNKEAIDLLCKNKSVFQHDPEMSNAIDLAIKALKNARPQGEFELDRLGRLVCPFCKELRSGSKNFCGYCGADLRTRFEDT